VKLLYKIHRAPTVISGKCLKKLKIKKTRRTVHHWLVWIQKEQSQGLGLGLGGGHGGPFEARDSGHPETGIKKSNRLPSRALDQSGLGTWWVFLNKTLPSLLVRRQVSRWGHRSLARSLRRFCTLHRSPQQLCLQQASERATRTVDEHLLLFRNLSAAPGPLPCNVATIEHAAGLRPCSSETASTSTVKKKKKPLLPRYPRSVHLCLFTPVTSRLLQ
jgi:hypothetical protein